MGDRFQTIIDSEATEAEAPALARRVLAWLVGEQIVVPERKDCALGEGHAPGPAYVKATGSPDENLLRWQTNGLEIEATRTVFHNGGDGFDIVCPSCNGRFEPPRGVFGDAVQEWYDRSGPGMLACPGCSVTRPVTEWLYDPPFGFGNLGFTFWNWPKLTEEFVSAVGQQLGHRVFVVNGKL